jgi:undecaprenyl-diphosphatase
VYGALGLLIVAALAVVVAGLWAFAAVAEAVREGGTQAFDDAVLRWIGAHQVPWIADAALKVTALASGTTIAMTVGIAAMFLWLTRHRHSAALLLITAATEVVINGLLKVLFGRPRPHIFTWGQHVVTSSFPSGHSMTAAAVYGTVAYLAARLQRRRVSRVLTLLAAGVVILLIGASRMYLGVHYPSDVAGGFAMGLAWAAFCMAALEAMQRLVARRAPEALAEELPPERATEEAMAAAGAARAAGALDAVGDVKRYDS